MNPFLQLEGTLGHLPDFNAGALNSEELHCVCQVDLSKLRVLVAMSDNLLDLASGCVVHWIGESGGLRCALKHTDTKASLLEVQIVMTHQAHRLRPVEVPD